jgi:hypothetical protein
VPDWPAELEIPISDEEPEAELPDLETALEEITAWAAELQPSTSEEESEPELPAFEVEDEEVPDWLAELQPSFEEGVPEPDLSVFEGEAVPDWLAELRPPTPEEVSELAPSAFEAGEEGEAETPIPTEEEFEPAVPDSEAMVEETPDWVAELRAEALAEAPPVEEAADEDVSPDWLVPSVPEPVEEETLARAEIPAWLLALKPAELRESPEEGPPPAAIEPLEETGLLAGVPGTLPVEMIIAQPRAVTRAEALEAPSADTRQANLFARILGRPPVAAPEEIVLPRKRGLAQVPRWIVYIALTVVVSLPLLLGEPLLPIAHTVEPAEATTDLHNSIDSLVSNAPVLVAFDYDPSSSGEMDVLAQALVGHLMDRGARVVAISLLPAGPCTAQSLLYKITTERADLVNSYGQRYVNLGYVPGDAAAVRLLGQSLEMAFPRDYGGIPLANLPVMEGLDATRSFDLIVELDAAQDTLRWCIEQASTPYGVEIGAGVSASVDPLVRPYYETRARQLAGMIGGIPGAASYEAYHSNQTSPSDETAVRLEAQLAGHLVLVLVLLVGNAVFLVQRSTGREQ